MDFQSLYTKECPGCGETYEANRLNQTFCTVRCKNRYHNNQQRASRMEAKLRSSITERDNKILWVNREVLRSFEEMETIDRASLTEAGFKFGYITRFQQSDPDVMPMFFIYDYGYKFIDSKTIKIFKT